LIKAFPCFLESIFGCPRELLSLKHFMSYAAMMFHKITDIIEIFIAKNIIL
jgi:hypothetical protein